MAIDAYFYNVSDDPRVINKTLGDGIKKSITIKGVDSVLNPTVVLKYDATIANYNYCYIPAPYNRYYFLAPPVLAPGKRMTFSCSVDPLMSHKDELENLNVLVNRVERNMYGDYNNSDYIDDNKAVGLIQPNVHTIDGNASPFSTTFDATKRNYVLTVVGGEPNS